MVDYMLLGEDLSGWTYIKTNNPRLIDDVHIEGFYSKVYEQTINDEVWSLGQFFLHDVELYRAWGIKTDSHCSYHVIQLEPNQIQAGCPNIKLDQQEDQLRLVIVGKQTFVYTVDKII